MTVTRLDVERSEYEQQIAALQQENERLKALLSTSVIIYLRQAWDGQKEPENDTKSRSVPTECYTDEKT